MRTNPTPLEQIADAYRRMADEARYRPQAPSDGLGNITVALEQLDLDEEAETYARHWWTQEDDGEFYIGCCNYPTRAATVFAIEAARCLCGAQDDVALELLRMAVAELAGGDTRERDLYDASRELGGLLLEAREGVPHAPTTIRGAIEAADAARLRSAEANGWSYGPLADRLPEADR